MSNSDRKPYLTSTVLDQEFLDAAHDNLTNQLEMVVDIQRPDGGFIRASDRNKYVGATFYSARTNFPIITRTIGELLSPEIEFSRLSLEINNVDGFFNDILPAGSDFKTWIGLTVDVRIGLRDVESTYKSIFRGRIADEGGFQRKDKSIVINARNDFDRLNANFPKAVFTKASFPNIDDSLVGVAVPIIYGDWTVNVETGMASVPAYVVNGLDANVNGDTAHTTNVQLLISDVDLTSFDSSQVYVKRGSLVGIFNSADITNIGAGNRSFEIKQGDGGGISLPFDGIPGGDTDPYSYARGDEFFVKVKGKDLGAYDDNIIWQARDILITYGSVSAGDFDANWATYRDKSSPAQSNISAAKSRIWIQEPQSVIQYVLSLLEQVRIEAFIDRNLKFKLASLHFEDFEADPDFTMRNWDTVLGTFQPRIDERNNFNRAQGTFNFLPNRNENFQSTRILRNDLAITNAGKEISKRIVFPNLFDETFVQLQTQELLRLASSYLENIDVELTWRAMLLDIGNFVKINVQIEGTVFEQVPAMIREIGYDPAGVKIPMRLFSFQMVPFGSWNPGYAGITGGQTATINIE